MSRTTSSEIPFAQIAFSVSNFWRNFDPNGEYSSFVQRSKRSQLTLWSSNSSAFCKCEHSRYLFKLLPSTIENKECLVENCVVTSTGLVGHLQKYCMPESDVFLRFRADICWESGISLYAA